MFSGVFPSDTSAGLASPHARRVIYLWCTAYGFTSTRRRERCANTRANIKPYFRTQDSGHVWHAVMRPVTIFIWTCTGVLYIQESYNVDSTPRRGEGGGEADDCVGSARAAVHEVSGRVPRGRLEASSPGVPQRKAGSAWHEQGALWEGRRTRGSQ